MKRNSGLGKGFGSLLPENFDQSVLLDKNERIYKVEIDKIQPNPDQPRKNFDKTSIEELASSIRRYGVLQPLVVTENNGLYTIIAGERRYHASKIAKLSTVPVLIRSLKDIEKLEIGLIENMQRVDLSPLEQALSIAKLNEQFNIPIQEIAVRLGKAHTTIVNTVRLLQLPDFATEALTKNLITEGHARAVLSLSGNIPKQKELVKKIIDLKWSVRQAEAYVKELKSGIKPQRTLLKKDKETLKAEENLTKKYNTKVKIAKSNRSFSVSFSFKSNKELDDFINKI